MYLEKVHWFLLKGIWANKFDYYLLVVYLISFDIYFQAKED